MKIHKVSSFILAAALALTLPGCVQSGKISEKNQPPTRPAAEEKTSPQTIPEQTAKEPAGGPVPGPSTQEPPETEPPKLRIDPAKPQIDLAAVKPNESGKIMVVMFHNFIESYTKGDKEYTTTFAEFGKLLQSLYDSGYRLINVSDFYNNKINVPAGFIPMVFTFDDGTAGQFNLVEENGKLVANKQSAVGIMEEFNKKHPDFGLKGTFYVNLGNSTFEGKGTVAERLKYLIDKGFEIGNHTYSHVMLNKVASADKVRQEVGENFSRMQELIPGYKMNSLSLPYGLPAKELQEYVFKGEFKGIKYENFTVMEVGWDPSVSPANPKFNPLSVHRVRASGITPVDADLGWWLKNLSRKEQYISDGDPDTVTVPEASKKDIDESKLKGAKLRTY